MVRRGVAPWLAAVAAMFAGGATSQAESGSERFAGVWLMNGQAELIQLTAGEVAYYDVTAVSCIETGRQPRSAFDARFRGGVSASSASSITAVDRTGEPYRLERLAELPARCRNGGTVGADPVLNFETFWRYFSENFANSEARGVDWDEVYREFRPRITAATTPDELWAIYAEIFGRFDDVHVFLSNGASGPAARSLSAGQPSGLRAAILRQNPALTGDAASDLDAELAPALNQLVLFDVLKGKYTTDLQGKFQWGWAAPEVGYLNIQAMYGLFAQGATDPAQVSAAVDRTMQRILADFGSARSLIIDVRQNRGGSDLVGRTVAAYFVPRPVTQATRARTATGFTPWHSITITPRADGGFRGRVYLLVSDNTVSAGETFVSAMRTSPRVTVVGTRTRGALSMILMKRLPDGSMLGLSNYQFRGPGGEDFEGRGIAPDVEAPSYDPDRLVAGYRDPIDRAVALATGATPR